MRIFGRKPLDRGGARRDYPDTLDVKNEADVRWIKQCDDPLVWHDVALACLVFRGDKHELLSWLVEQPSLDRVTAAAIFLHRDNGMRHLRREPVELGKVEPGGAQAARENIDRAIGRLCDLDGGRTLPDHGIGMEAGWEQSRIATLAALAAQPRGPVRILERPIDRQAAIRPYVDLGEGELTSLAFIEREMPYLLP